VLDRACDELTARESHWGVYCVTERQKCIEPCLSEGKDRKKS